VKKRTHSGQPRRDYTSRPPACTAAHPNGLGFMWSSQAGPETRCKKNMRHLRLGQSKMTVVAAQNTEEGKRVPGLLGHGGNKNTIGCIP